MSLNCIQEFIHICRTVLQENESKISDNPSIEYLKVQEQLLERVEHIERSYEERLKNIEEKLDYRNKLLLETLEEIQDTKNNSCHQREKMAGFLEVNVPPYIQKSL